jgi:hypothetical protein
MSNSSAAAKVIDLEAFRQRRMRDSKENESAMPAAMFVPVWFCWVPVWAPVVR